MSSGTDAIRQTGQTYNQSVDMNQATQPPPSQDAVARELLNQTINADHQFEPRPGLPLTNEDDGGREEIEPRLVYVFPSQLDKEGNIRRYRPPRSYNYNLARCRSDTFNLYLRDELFVERRACQKAYEFLKENRVITLLGHSGDGISVLALWLLKTISDEVDCDSFRFHQPSEWSKVYEIDWRNGEQMAFVMDNMFGCSSVSDHTMSDWHPYTRQMWDYVESKNLYIIFTSKKHLFYEGRRKFPNSDLFAKRYIFDLTLDENQLTYEEKKEILRKYLVFKRAPTDVVENLPRDSPTHGFPLIMSQYAQIPEYHKWEHRFFMNPILWYVKEFNCVSATQNDVWGILLLILLGGGVIRPYDFELRGDNKEKKERIKKLMNYSTLREGFLPGRIKEMCKDMERDYVIYDEEEEGYRFLYDYFADACMVVFGKWRFKEVAEECTLDFLFEYIVTNKIPLDRPDKEISLEYYTSAYEYLTKRFYKEMLDGHVELLICHRAFLDRTFLEAYVTYIKEEDRLGKLLQTQDENCGKRIVPLLAMYGMTDFLKQVVDSSDCRRLSSKDWMKSDKKEALETARTYKLMDIENILK